MEKKIKRRAFIETTLRYGATVMMVPILLQACKSDGGESSDTKATAENALDVTSCDDLSKTPESEIKKRVGFGYVEESPMPEQHCKNCQLYLPPQEGKSCGGCALFQGPVFENGYCTYWAPIV